MHLIERFAIQDGKCAASWLRDVMIAFSWNQRKASEKIGIPVATLRNALKRHGLFCEEHTERQLTTVRHLAEKGHTAEYIANKCNVSVDVAVVAGARRSIKERRDYYRQQRDKLLRDNPHLSLAAAARYLRHIQPD